MGGRGDDDDVEVVNRSVAWFLGWRIAPCWWPGVCMYLKDLGNSDKEGSCFSLAARRN